MNEAYERWLRRLDHANDDITGPHGHALPGDKPAWPRDRVVDFQHVELQITVDPATRSVSGTATHTVASMNAGPLVLSLDAVEMTVSAVLVGGKATAFDYDGATIRVPLGTARRGEEFTVATTYEAHPRIGLYFPGPDEGYPEKPSQVWSQGQDEDNRYWFPCYDHTNDKQTSEMIVTVPGDWYALSNGRLHEEKANKNGTRTFHWKQERPHATYLITLAAGKFSRIDASRDGLVIDYFVEEKDVANARTTFANTPEMITCFEKITGMKYPWAKYSQIVVRDFVFGGMENTTATTMTEDLILDEKASRDSTGDYLISHELAHMWFGDLLTCRDWGHGWLNESFATYLESLWDEHKRGIDEYRQGVVENTDAYLGERYRRPIVSNVWNEPIDVFDRHLYEKGSVVLHMLRVFVGDDGFFRSIQRYVRENQDRSVVTADLAAAFEVETGRNIEWFFQQWVHSPGHPEFKVNWSWDDATSCASVSVRQLQSTANGTPVFRIPLTIDFRSGRKKPTAFRVEVDSADHTFVFPLPARPDLCRFDPHNEVLKTVDFNKSTGEVILQLADDDDIAGRQWAAKELGKKGGLEAVRALEAAVSGDRFWAVQGAAARALGAIGGESARDALLRCLKVRHPKARRGVVAGLGAFRGDATVLAALVAISKKDQSYFVEAEANRSIGKLRCEGSYEAIAANFDRRSFRETVRVGCIDGLAELRDARALDLLASATRYGEPAQARRWATLAMGRLVKHLPEREAEASDRLAELLRDPDFRVRVSAANALRELGDASIAVKLDEMASRELDGRAIRAARYGALELRKGSNTSSEVQSLRNEMEEMKTDNASLRDRLAKLEAVAKAGTKG